jgi:phosphatidylglycerophosphate synthase
MRRASREEGAGAWVLMEPSQPDLKLWGVPATERLRRALCAAGVPPERIGMGPGSEAHGWGGALLLLRSDYVFDDRLIRSLVASENTVLIVPPTPSARVEAAAVHVAASRLAEALRLLRGGQALEMASRETGLRFLGPADLAPVYAAALRKVDPPYLLPVRPENLAAIESQIFQASYKGVTDLVTKWVWPLPARAVTRLLARAGIHPNTVTLLSWALVVLAALLFTQGRFGLGLAVAWLMTFLDTVDGKLARVTLTSSRVGHVLDHGLDILHPPFWYLAWAGGLPAEMGWLGLATVITVGGYVTGRLIEGVFLLAFKMEIHSWRPLDSHFRTITARRNPNLLLLTVGVLTGRPDVGLVLVAVWTACSIGFHTVRLAQALIERRRGHPVRVWQEAQEGQEAAQGTEAVIGDVPDSSGSLA